MKKIIVPIICLGLFLMFNCGDSDQYNKGYNDGYYEVGQLNSNNANYTEGYYDGECDSIWDAGYDNAYNGLKPAYPEDDTYMDGYKHGKHDKRGY